MIETQSFPHCGRHDACKQPLTGKSPAIALDSIRKAKVMRILNVFQALMCLAYVTLAAGKANADTWPSRPITLICPFGAGGAPDIIARFVAQELSDKLGQKV